MKRSRSLVLTSMMAGAGVSLTACDATPDQVGGQPVDAVSYTSVAACKADGKVPADQCEKAYRDADAADAKSAPRFEDRGTCEERYGVDQCVPRNNGSFFTPLLTGFIIGQALNNIGGGYGGYRGAPLYRDRDGGYSGYGGVPITRDYLSGRTRIGSNAFDTARAAPVRVQSRSAVISRGGFGGFGGRGFGG